VRETEPRAIAGGRELHRDHRLGTHGLPAPVTQVSLVFPVHQRNDGRRETKVTK